MTQTQLKCFLTVAEQGSFSKAANLLFISLPAVSKNVAKLEEEMGFAFFERKAGRVRITPAGRRLYRCFRQQNEDLQALLADIHSSLQDSSGSVRIGCPDLWNPACFYDKILEHCRRQLPQINLIFDCYRPQTLLSRLQAGQVDLVLSHSFFYSIPQGMTVIPLTNTDTGILYSKTHFGEIHSLADLRDERFLIYERDLGKVILSHLRQICGQYGFSPQIRYCANLSVVAFLMSCGQGVFFCSGWENIVESKSYSFLRLDSSMPVHLIFPAHSPNRSVAQVIHALSDLYAADRLTDQDA